MDTTMENSTIPASIEPFLIPISEAKPCGDWLRYDAMYDKIQEARREDDSTLDQGVWQKALKKADWSLAQRLCTDVLINRSKDLQVAVWLLEAWMNLRGFEGIDEGLTLASQLCYKFWDNLYPALEDGDSEYRIAPMLWLNEKLFHKPKWLPCTKPRSRDIPSYNFIDWEGILILENTLRKNPYAIPPEELENKITREKFRISMLNTPLEYYMELSVTLLRTLETLAHLEKFLDEKCGKQSPSFKLFRDVITKIERFTGEVIREREIELAPPPPPPPEPEVIIEEPEEMEYYDVSSMTDDSSSQYTSQEPAYTPASTPMYVEERQEAKPIGVQETERKIMQNMSTAIRTREDAYKRLNDAADFLLKAEPHSPVPYLIKRAISWGEMPLPQLLNELVYDPNDRNAIFGLLGMPIAPPPAAVVQSIPEW